MKGFLKIGGLSNIKLNVGFMEAEFEAKPDDQEAAWEMYVELIMTQELGDEDGDEKTALDSGVYLFAITREILKRKNENVRHLLKLQLLF